MLKSFRRLCQQSALNTYYATVLIGRITCIRRPSVSLSVPYGLHTRKQKSTEQIKIGVNVPQYRSYQYATF